jgi:hypothetical protein
MTLRLPVFYSQYSLLPSLLASPWLSPPNCQQLLPSIHQTKAEVYEHESPLLPSAMVDPELEGLTCGDLPLPEWKLLCTDKSPVNCFFLPESLSLHRPIWVSIFSSTKGWQTHGVDNSSSEDPKGSTLTPEQNQTPRVFPPLSFTGSLKPWGSLVYVKWETHFLSYSTALGDWVRSSA